MNREYKTPEHVRARKRDSARKYRAANPERVKESREAFDAKYPGRRREMMDAWRKNNPEKLDEYRDKYKSRRSVYSARNRTKRKIAEKRALVDALKSSCAAVSELEAAERSLSSLEEKYASLMEPFS